MYEFLMIVGAIIVANVLTGLVGFTVLFNDRFIKWYTRKVFKLSKAIEEGMYELEEEDDTL